MMRFIVLALIAIAMLAPPARAADPVPGPVRAQVLRTIDGDSFAARAEVWPGLWIETTVRIAGLDTPERRGRCPEERQGSRRATEALAALLAGGTATLGEIRRGKYAGRVIARVATAEAADVAAAMIAAGLGRPYAGGKRRGWCGADATGR